MEIDSTTPRSRRVLLAGALGATAVTVAAAIGRPDLVRAANGETVLVGGQYDATLTTGFDAGTSGRMALKGESDSAYGVFGNSISSHGVHGASGSSNGVVGYSKEDTGVYGASSSTNRPATIGRSQGDSTGVFGWSSQPGDARPTAPARTGVYGYAAQDATATGVRGESTTGRGVVGVAASGIGVRAHAPTGTGVSASTTSGTGVYATTGGLKSGTALRTVGRVRFDNSVGIATIAAGTSSVTVTPGIDLTATSAVVATLQGDAGGSTTVKRISMNPTTDMFTIYLTANATTAVKVAWHVFG